MPEDPKDWRASQDRHELHDPSNPPNALLKPETRSRALMSYVAPIVVLFVIVGIALIYWANRGPSTSTPDETENAVGTVGTDAPGGFDPVPRFGDTADEVEFRGGADGNAAAGGAGAAETLMDVDAVANTTGGRRVRLQDVEVDAVDENIVWVASGDSRVAVTPPAGTRVRAGDRIDLSGTTEMDERGAVRIRASELNAR